jgi:hypothetical protein
MRILICFILIQFTLFVQAQQKKSMPAFYITAPITIDGILDEQVYKDAQPAKDFVQLQPYNGKPSFQPSEVYIFYDQTAVYVGGMFYDSSPDSIFNFVTERDNIGMSDYFGIYLDPYNQGQLAYGFFITPAGVQTDIKAIKSSDDNEDESWDAVWQSKTRITEKGWAVEMRIPYSALRFPENGNGTWGVNMFRNIRRYNSNNSWNFIDREVAGFIHQEGELTGIKNIRPPVRLSLSPYGAAYIEYKDGNSRPDFIYKGGLDLKYGLSESFTLDMMLVPDFGQIQSDDKELNLSPYELFYDEKRQFFTEGTELFDRGDIFYSRRIGAAPKFADRATDELALNEVVDYNPTETQLLNATKISGRTSKGWGLGMLNAISLPSHAKLKDTITGEKREVLIQPLTNYNIAVIDKSLPNNSYISLINSNLIMVNEPYTANVTATDFQFRNKKKTWAVIGKAGFSSRKNDEKENGYFTKLGFEKNGGKFRYGISQNVVSDKFNPNDLGYLRRNNELFTELFAGYHIIKPFSIFREMHTTFWMDHERIFKSSRFSGNSYGINHYSQFKNNYGVEVNFHVYGKNNDYYEPRVDGWHYTEPWYYEYNLWLYSDPRKAFNISAGLAQAKQPLTDQQYINVDFYADMRIGRKLQLSYNLTFENGINDRGYVDNNDNEDSIFFAKRNLKTLQNVLGASYAFNNKAGLNLRIRHYWSGASNKNYYILQRDGDLVLFPEYTENKDDNYNAFNVDLIFKWIFAPGSEFSIAWKNSILTDTNIVQKRYWTNLGNTWKADQTNSFSNRLLYYIDYNQLRKKT